MRRGPRPRTADDDDWGTSDPPIPMDLPHPHPHQHQPDIDAVEADPTPKPRTPVIERLKQQELSSYTVTFSPKCVIAIYFVIAFLFMPLGAAIIAGTSRINSSGRKVYTEDPTCALKDGKVGEPKSGSCTVTVNFTNTVHPPSYFYYSLTNFYQNARKYAKSRSDTMNQGQLPKTFFDVETCTPYLYRNDSSKGAGGFDASEFIYPCGLTARSFFNDTFLLCRDIDCKDEVDLRKGGIAWWTDVQHKFNVGKEKEFTEPYYNRVPANDLLEDEDFLVWMRLSAFPNFDKLYRIIDVPLFANTQYFVKINTHFPVEEFGGTKAFYISTTSWCGGPNAFLGTAYLVVGFIALFIATTLLVKHIRHPRPPAYSDPARVMRELAKLNMEYRVPQPGQ